MHDGSQRGHAPWLGHLPARSGRRLTWSAGDGITIWMRRLLALALIASCSKSSPRSAPEPLAGGPRADEDRAGGAVSAESGPVTTAARPPDSPPPGGPDGNAPTGSGDSRAQLAKQTGVLGSTTSSQGSAFASLGGKDISSGFDDEKRPDGERRAQARSPSLRLGSAAVTGNLDKAIVERYVRRDLRRLLSCYEQELRASPALGGGTMSVKLAIDGKGRVSNVAAKGVHGKVESCVATVIGQIEFPRPRAGEVQVAYVFTFDPGT